MLIKNLIETIFVIFLYIARDLMIDALQANHGKLFSYPVDVCGNQRWAITCSMIIWVPIDVKHHNLSAL